MRLSEPSTTHSYFWCNNRLLSMSKTFNTLDSLAYSFFTLTATEKPCFVRKCKVYICQRFPLIWSVRSKSWYGTVVIKKYGWLTWKPTKSGVLQWRQNCMEGAYNTLNTLNKPKWPAWVSSKESIVNWYTTALRIWRKNMQNQLFNGNISLIAIIHRLSSATTTPRFCSNPLIKNKLLNFNTST